MATTSDNLESLAAAWARVGVLFNVRPADQTPDVERLLLETVRAAPSHSRLFSAAAAWLNAFGEFVDSPRLARLVRAELEVDHRPAMGLLLESAQRSAPRHQSRFDEVIAACAPAAESSPLFDVDRQGPVCIELARQHASPLSRKWGRWAPEVIIRERIIRPLDWVISHNPELATRTQASSRS